MLFLTHLFDILFPPRSDEEIVRTITEGTLSAMVSLNTVRQCTPNAVALLPFAHAQVRALIHEAKYHENTRAFELLGYLLYDYLTDIMSEEGFGKVVLVPLPLSAARLKARGYNQSEEMAKRAVCATVVLATDLLVRVRDTASQTTLSRAARVENMHGAFGAVHILDPSITYLLLDDVITTGATMQSAIDALTSAGALHILPLALAH